jgi:hypothetical protein
LINIAGLSAADTNFITAAALILIIFSIVQLLLELVRLIRQLHIFFVDFDTWVKVPLFIFTNIFVLAVVLDQECFCPRNWQWEIGVAAVFLVWIDLILYMRRMRVLGK